MLDCIDVADASVGVVMEKWLDGEEDELAERFSAEHGSGMLARNRTDKLLMESDMVGWPSCEKRVTVL